MGALPLPQLFIIMASLKPLAPYPCVLPLPLPLPSSGVSACAFSLPLPLCDEDTHCPYSSSAPSSRHNNSSPLKESRLPPAAPAHGIQHTAPTPLVARVEPRDTLMDDENICCSTGTAAAGGALPYSNNNNRPKRCRENYHENSLQEHGNAQCHRRHKLVYKKTKGNAMSPTKGMCQCLCGFVGHAKTVAVHLERVHQVPSYIALSAVKAAERTPTR